MIAGPEFDTEADLWVIDLPLDRPDDEDLSTKVHESLAHIGKNGGGAVNLWIHGVTEAAHDIAIEHGFVAFRDLWQLRCELPAEPSSLDTRAFTLDDVDALVGVNNRAFSWHPEQSGMTPESLSASTEEPWFSFDGFRIFERDGVLTGFCWTKVHSEHDPVLGEIYVIAIDPSAHGQGLGTPMTLAGLDWLSAQGIATGMLYVESDNDPANATYRRIGFERHHTDRAYSKTVAGAGSS